MLNSWFDTWARVALDSLSDRNLPNLPGLIALKGSNNKIYFVAHLTNLADFREKLSCQFGNPVDIAQVFDPEASIIFWAFPQHLTEILGSELIDLANQIAENLPLKKKSTTPKLLTGVSVDPNYTEDSHSELVFQ